jgi:hypothetical protein
MEFSKEPRLAPYIKPSTVLVVDGTEIGVIGYLTPETRVSSSSIEKHGHYNLFSFFIVIILNLYLQFYFKII